MFPIIGTHKHRGKCYCHCCFYRIRDLRRIRRYMSFVVAKTTAIALVIAVDLTIAIPFFTILLTGTS